MSGVHKIEIKDIVHNVYYQNNGSLFLELVQLINQNPYRYVTKITSKCSKKSYKDYSYMHYWIDQMVPQLSNYNYATKCYWIIYGITTFPKCKNENCSHLIDKQISFWQGIKQYCSVHCQITSREFKEQRKETWKRNLGVEYPTQSKQVIQLRQMNNLIKYNVTEPSKLPNVIKKRLSTKQKKNGGKYVSEKTIQNTQKTNLQLYGHVCSLHSKENEKNIHDKWSKKYRGGHPLSDLTIRKKGEEKCLQKYGSKNYSQSKEYHDLWKDEEWKNRSISKQIATKKKNNSFHISREETKAYDLLKFIFPNLIQHYKSETYPFLCDFYDPDSNTYIELNAHWTHGKHFFDLTSQEDLKLLEKWKEKAKISKFYKNAIETWTVRDVKKREVAKKNGLKYLVFWNLKEVSIFINQHMS